MIIFSNLEYKLHNNLMKIPSIYSELFVFMSHTKKKVNRFCQTPVLLKTLFIYPGYPNYFDKY